MCGKGTLGQSKTREGCTARSQQGSVEQVGEMGLPTYLLTGY